MSLAQERPRSRGAGWIVAGLVLALLAGFGYWAFNRTRPAAATVARRDIIAHQSLEGEVAVPPDDRADVYSSFSAPVAKVYTTVGQKVRKGEVLVELEFTNAQAAYEQARANVKAAEAALEEAKRAYAPTVAAAQQQLTAARTAEVTARQGAQPPVRIAPDGSSTYTPPAAVDTSALTSTRMGAEQAVAQAQAGMQAAVIPFQQQLEGARDAFQAAQSGRKLAMLRAPISGEVMAVNVRPGQQVTNDRKTPAVIIVDLSELLVVAKMNQEEAARVQPKLPVVLTFDQVPGTRFEGQVTSVAAMPEKLLSGPRFLASVDFKNSQGVVKLGMKGRVAVKLGEVKKVIAVPSDAVDKDSEGRAAVELMKGGQWVRTLVETGLSDGEYTEIKSGVKEGDTVKVTPELVG